MFSKWAKAFSGQCHKDARRIVEFALIEDTGMPGHGIGSRAGHLETAFIGN
jgi:hypothetical protein